MTGPTISSSKPSCRILPKPKARHLQTSGAREKFTNICRVSSDSPGAGRFKRVFSPRLSLWLLVFTPYSLGILVMGPRMTNFSALISVIRLMGRGWHHVQFQSLKDFYWFFKPQISHLRRARGGHYFEGRSL